MEILVAAASTDVPAVNQRPRIVETEIRDLAQRIPAVLAGDLVAAIPGPRYTVLAAPEAQAQAGLLAIPDPGVVLAGREFQLVDQMVS
jgi:endonuclease/exonuclease/phosphatase family metal-dependent hydrolase